MASINGIDGSSFTSGIFDNPESIEQLQRRQLVVPIGNVDLGPLSSREQLIATINSGSWGQPKLAASGPVTCRSTARPGSGRTWR